jgi:hypothetical protein
LITASKLAGFFAAHAIWSLSDGDGFIPMLAYTDADDKRNMTRLVFDNERDAVELGRQRLAANEMDANDAVLLFDGRIPLGNSKVDAVILELRCYFSPDSEAMIAVPYTPKSSGRFLVHRPKLVDWKNCDDFDQAAAFESFWQGVEEHEEGSKIWSSAMDESK